MKPIVLLTALWVLAGCAAKKTITLSGNTYVGVENQKFLRFNDNKFDLRGITRFIDTLSYGEWKQEGNMIVLHSEKDFYREIYDIEVIESISGSRDSVYIEIENVLNGLTDAEDYYMPYVHFSATAHFSSGSVRFTEHFVRKQSLAKFKKTLLKELDLMIMPNFIIYDQKISGTAFRTYRYEVKSFENNTFKIKVLDFEVNYFSRIPLNGEYIKIINNDTLLWDNEFYVNTKKQKKPITN